MFAGLKIWLAAGWLNEQTLVIVSFADLFCSLEQQKLLRLVNELG